MFPSSEKNDGADSSPVNARGPTERTCDVLERFLHELALCERSADQVRLILTSIRNALLADVVYWYPLAPGESLEVAGDHGLSTDWYRYIAQRLLADSNALGSQVLLPNLAALPNLYPMTPRSAAMTRMSKSRPAWIIALRFAGDQPFGDADLKVLGLFKRVLLNHRQQTRIYDKLKETLFGLVTCLTKAIDAKDTYTCGHSERVARIAVRLGQQMGLPGSFLSDLYLAGLLHDIGKIGIGEGILQKPGALTPEEIAQVQAHPVHGEQLLITIPQMEHLRPAVRHHHERIDGKGYPDHLVAENIPLAARILAVADACDAMMSNRPYRAAMAPERICTILSEGAGLHWDSEIVRHFMACRDELFLICRQHAGMSVLFQAVKTAAEGGSDFVTRK